jgi:hypothetical protein
MRPPADASSGYSGHRQQPASFESRPSGSGHGNVNGQHTSTNAPDSTSGPISKKPADYENFWEAPSFLWVQKEVSEREMEAVMVREWVKGIGPRFGADVGRAAEPPTSEQDHERATWLLQTDGYDHSES